MTGQELIKVLGGWEGYRIGTVGLGAEGKEVWIELCRGLSSSKRKEFYEFLRVIINFRFGKVGQVSRRFLLNHIVSTFNLLPGRDVRYREWPRGTMAAVIPKRQRSSSDVQENLFV